MELRKINTEDACEQWMYTTALPADENGLTNPHHGVTYEEYVSQVLPALISYENPVNMPDWFVPETYYYLWDGECLVGEFRIRHYLTDALRNGAGHIGYSIRKDKRGRGYGTAGLKMTLDIARDMIPEEEIYLRVNKDNIASQKVMLKNGARIAGEDDRHYFMRIPKHAACAHHSSQEDSNMVDFGINEMLEMQKALQEKYKEQWKPISPERGKDQLLWMVGEIGEVIDIIKKNGGEAASGNAELRAHLVEELADVLMYYNDILLCYGISAEELKQSYTRKFERNMTRW